MLLLFKYCRLASTEGRREVFLDVARVPLRPRGHHDGPYVLLLKPYRSLTTAVSEVHLYILMDDWQLQLVVELHCHLVVVEGARVGTCGPPMATDGGHLQHGMVSRLELALVRDVKLILLRAELVVMQASRVDAGGIRFTSYYLRVVQLVLVTVVVNDDVDVGARGEYFLEGLRPLVTVRAHTTLWQRLWIGRERRA